MVHSMRKSDMIAYYTPVRRFGEYHREEHKGYCFYWVTDEGERFPFMIRKDDRVGKGWQVDEYGTGLKVGGNYQSINAAAASVIFMIHYHDLLGTITRTHTIQKMRHGQLLNEGDPVGSFPASCYNLNEREGKANAADQP